MKTTYKAIVSVVVAVLLLTACEQSENYNTPNERKIAIIPELAGMYVNVPGNWSSTRADAHPELSKITNLAEGSTLRLIAKKTNAQTTTVKDYVVRTVGGGSQSLYPCTLNPDGTVANEDKTPLYLSVGTYTFSAVSPAHKYNNGKMTINNAESVIATNNRWRQTEASIITISNDDKSKVIPINPLIQLTSRMTFTLKGDRGSGVSSLSVMQDGIEIDRIRENAAVINNVGDDIPAIITDNYHRIYIKEKDIRQDNGNLRGEICLLPIDNRPTPMMVILNLMVNGVPTQFSFSIVNKILEGGYSYDYIVTIKIKDNITVANWQETSWSTTVPGGGIIE